MQAHADVECLVGICEDRFTPAQIERMHAGALAAYRRQYLGRGIEDARFAELVSRMLDAGQMRRFRSELASILL